MHEKVMNEQLRLATVERIASYSVGIMVEKNTGVGTGTLITDGIDIYILTAAHNVQDVDVQGLRFWLRPNKAIIEKAAQDTTIKEVGRLTVGVPLPIVETRIDPERDIALLRIDQSFCLPEGPEVYPLGRSFEFADWPEGHLDGISTLMFGFPVANSRPLHTVGNNTFCFLGSANMLSRYSAKINAENFRGLSNSISSHTDFLLEYTGEGLDPHGFSGCGVWIPTDTEGQKVWAADPALIGVSNQYFRRSNLISATKLPAIVTIAPLAGDKNGTS
ncbi:hypothetical protein BH10ACI4_BH10ACI4_33820 [soil metagenome]